MRPRGRTNMAESAAGNAQLEVTERRLRPLYDALDYGQHKKALQIAEKILKKQADLKCAKILKSIALLRLGRSEEANELVAKVMSTHPGDQATLQALTLFYRETGDFQKIAEVYADAAKHYPKNQEILTHLFMAYVRVGDSQKQQQAAAQLCKAFPQNGPYHCWRIMSILLQADEARGVDLAKNMYLPLAGKLIEKYFKEHTVEAEAEVRLYLMVLDKLDKVNEKLEILQGPHGERIKNQNERSSLTVETLQSLGRWEEASSRLLVMLESNPDWWDCIRQYISCQIQKAVALFTDKDTGSEKGEGLVGVATSASDGNPDDKGESPDNQTDSADTQTAPTEDWLRPLLEARDVMDGFADIQLKKFENKEMILRGPLLGRLEVLKQVSQLKEVMKGVPLAPASDLLDDYFRLFGTKSCVFDDLKLYVDSTGLSADEVEKFLKRLEDEINSDPLDFDCGPNKFRENLSRMRRYINLIQLQRCHGQHQLPLCEKKSLVRKCLHRYSKGLKLGQEFRDTVSQPGDFFIILAAHLTMELYQETGDVSNVWETVFMLEGVRHHNSQVSLILMKLYGHLGATECITDLFNESAIKHIQTETLGYLPARYLQSMGTFGFANQLYRGAFRFFFNSSKEISEYIIQAYKNGAFHKIPEMIFLREKLTHSFNFASTMVDMNMLELVTTVNSCSDALVFFQKEWRKGMPYASSNLKDYCSRLVDSRDLRVLDDWSPPSQRLTEVEIKISFDLECLWLRTRICLMKCFHAAISCLPHSNMETEEATKDESDGLLSQRIEDLSGTLDMFEQHVGTMLLKQRSKCQLLPIQAPPPCLGYTFHREGHGVILRQMLVVVKEIVSGADTVREGLENILTRLQASKSRINGVSPDLREAMIKTASPTIQDTTTDGDVVVTSPFDTEHPYDIITRQRIDLEEYVLFLQTMSHLALLSGVCAEFLVPSLTASGGKKKKKKPIEQKPISLELANFMKELMILLMSVSQSFQPFPSPPGGDEAKLLRQLSEMYIGQPQSSLTGATYTRDGEIPSVSDEEDPLIKAHKTSVSKACAGVVSSYNMSFRDTLEVVTAKLQVFRSAVKQLGGHVD